MKRRQPQRARRQLYVSQLDLDTEISLAGEKGHDGCYGDKLMQHLQPLRSQLRVQRVKFGALTSTKLGISSGLKRMTFPTNF